MMGYLFTIRKIHQMAYTEFVLVLRRSIQKMKNKKENKKLTAAYFLLWKVCREACAEGFCSATQVSCQQVRLPLPEDWKRMRQLWGSGYYTCLHKVWKLYATCSLIFPTDDLLLAKQMFLTEYCLAVCKQLLSETLPKVYTFLVHRYLCSPALFVTLTVANLIWVLFLLIACLV